MVNGITIGRVSIVLGITRLAGKLSTERVFVLYKNHERRRLVTRGSVRTMRHGNWRQTYIDCSGMCVARVNGDDAPCGVVDSLELHEMWGENGDPAKGKFQQRVLLCNLHHSLLEDRCHQAEFMLWQYRPSRLQEDIQLEIMLASGYDGWIKKWNLDDGRAGCALFSGPHVEDFE